MVGIYIKYSRFILDNKEDKLTLIEHSFNTIIEIFEKKIKIFSAINKKN